MKVKMKVSQRMTKIVRIILKMRVKIKLIIKVLKMNIIIIRIRKKIILMMMNTILVLKNFQTNMKRKMKIMEIIKR